MRRTAWITSLGFVFLAQSAPMVTTFSVGIPERYVIVPSDKLLGPAAKLVLRELETIVVNDADRNGTGSLQNVEIVTADSLQTIPALKAEHAEELFLDLHSDGELTNVDLIFKGAYHPGKTIHTSDSGPNKMMENPEDFFRPKDIRAFLAKLKDHHTKCHVDKDPTECK